MTDTKDLQKLKIINPGDVRTITPPITLEKGMFIVDAKGIIVAYLEYSTPKRNK